MGPISSSSRNGSKSESPRVGKGRCTRNPSPSYVCIAGTIRETFRDIFFRCRRARKVARRQGAKSQKPEYAEALRLPATFWLLVVSISLGDLKVAQSFRVARDAFVQRLGDLLAMFGFP